MNILSFFIPNIAYAAGAGDTFKSIVEYLVNFISKSILPVIIGLSLVAIFWNLGQYILKSDQEKERENFGKYAMWSIFAFFLALSIWGVLKILGNTLLLNDGNLVVPQFPTETEEE